MWKFIVDVVHDLVSSLPADVGRGFLHVSDVFLFYAGTAIDTEFSPHTRRVRVDSYETKLTSFHCQVLFLNLRALKNFDVV